MQYASAGRVRATWPYYNGSESMTSTRDYLGTLAVNLRVTAENVEELRRDGDLIHAMGGDLMRDDILKLERAAIAFRAQIMDARRALHEARSAARIAIDAAQAARREARL